MNSKQVMSENIQRMMHRKGVTNQQLCDALGFKYTTFIDWINAKTYPRIGKVEAMAEFFGCQKSDLIEEKKKPVEDGLTEQQRALIDFARAVPEEKAALVLKVMRSIVEDEG